MIVDDDILMGRVFELGFHEQGVHVVYFSSPARALEWIGGSIPNVAVIDLVMPGMSGIEFCRVLRSTETTKDLPIILVSGKNEEDLRRAADEVGAVGYCTKPFVVSRLFALIKSHLPCAAQG